MYSILFRNRWFAALWAVGILATAYNVATKGFGTPAQADAVANARASEAAYASWAQDGEKAADAPLDDNAAYNGGQSQTVETRYVPESNNHYSSGDDTAE